jgi:hypothetical protein
MDLLIVGCLFLIVAVGYYLSRRSNKKAAARLHSATPTRRISSDQLVRYEQMRAEHLSQAQAAQTDNQIGGFG